MWLEMNVYDGVFKCFGKHIIGDGRKIYRKKIKEGNNSEPTPQGDHFLWWNSKQQAFINRTIN